MGEHKVFSELSIYDVFLGVVGHGSITQERLKETMWLRDDSNVEDCLAKLVDLKLLTKKNGEYKSTESSQAQCLLQILSFALAVGLDYNFYFQEEVQTFIKANYGRLSFNKKNAGNLEQRQFYKLVRRLCMDSLAVVFSYDPLSGKLINNLFLDLLCTYWNVTPHKPGFFERRAKLDYIIVESQAAKAKNNRTKIVSSTPLYVDIGETKNTLLPGIGRLQSLLKHDIIPLNPDIFDSKQSVNSEIANRYMEQLTDATRQLNLQIIASYHSMLMTGKDEPQAYRTFEVSIGNNPNFRASAAKDIERDMRDFFEIYKKNSLKVRTVPKALELAAYVYSQLIHIQPYDDGNSRMSMLAMLHVLKLFKTGIDAIPRSYDFSFIQLTKGVAKRNDAELVHLLREVCMLTINKAEFLEMLQYA